MVSVPTPKAPEFADLLRRYRVAAGLTQEALAERAGLSARGIYPARPAHAARSRGARYRPSSQVWTSKGGSPGAGSTRR